MRLRRVAPLLLLAIAAACHDPVSPESRDLDHARTLWTTHSVVNYDFTLRRECFCDPTFNQPLRVRVRAGVVVGATVVATGEVIAAQYVVTIDQIFADIESTIQRGKILGVSYDPVYGYPTEARLDRITNAVDDEGNYFISDFLVIP